MYLLAILAVLAIVSCSKDDGSEMDPQTQSPDTQNPDTPGGDVMNDSITYFTLNVNEFWIDDLIRSTYIVINDMDGKLIDYKKVENDNQYEFKVKEEDAKDLYTVTQFVDFAGGGGTFRVNSASTYYNIKQGAVWSFNGFPPPLPGPDTDLSFDLAVENIEGWSDYVLSTDNGFIRTTFDETPSSLDFSGLSIEENSKYMLTVHFDSQPSKYIILENLIDGDKVTINGDELLAFDSSVAINLPDNGKVYTKSLTANTKITPAVSDNLNVLDAFSNYIIFIDSSDEAKNFTYRYENRTSSPKDINLSSTDFDFNIVNNSIDGFKFETTKNHDTKLSRWQEQVTMDTRTFLKYWTFNSDDKAYGTIPELPEALLTEFTDFKVENLEYNFTSLTVGGNSHTFGFENPGVSVNDQELVTEIFTFNNPATKNKMQNNKELPF